MQRAEGYYWVKKDDVWEIAEWSICWERIGDEIVRNDSDFDEIDERRIERTEKAILPDGDYDPIPDNPTAYISDNPYICKPD